MISMTAGAGLDIQDADLKHVSGLCVTDVYRTRADMNPEAFAGTTAADTGIHRPCATTVDVLAVGGPVKDRLGSGIPCDHAFPVV